MVIIVAGLLLLAVVGYISIPFVAKDAFARFGMNQKRRETLETAIKLEIDDFKNQDETMSL
ncbi:MAG: hypothetical protein RBT80_10025 [Candidatus Vecturithrix sp.]|jgi:hypothetical protein|nr:hypothetical protein [Candidatus Vecturithrix sp.]